MNTARSLLCPKVPNIPFGVRMPVKLVALPGLVGKRTWRKVPSRRLLGRSSRKSGWTASIEVGTQTAPRSFIFSFYSILRGSPTNIQTSCNSHTEESRKQVCLQIPLRCALRAGQPPPRYTISTHTPSFQYPRLSKRGYASSVDLSQASRSRKPISIGDVATTTTDASTVPKHSVLNPPKKAPSVWQIFFTDWLQVQRTRVDRDKKLNVAQEAKDAGTAYNRLPDEERDALKLRAQHLKDKYEREVAAWKCTLTPTDIERENAFRTAQRKSGKSRRKNINDPNAPKRPLTAYFLFLQAIRADPQMIRDIFGGTVETTRQSVLAAAKWRSMGDDEKRHYLSQAESARAEYEAARRAYEEQVRDAAYTVTSVMVYPRFPRTTSQTQPGNVTVIGASNGPTHK